MSTTLRIGQRVADREGFIGTVRYIGPVATSKSAETQYAGASVPVGITDDVQVWGNGAGYRDYCAALCV